MNDTVIIYHGGGCADGFCAAFSAWLKFGDDATYIPANYGDDLPKRHTVEGRNVYLLDFSYKREMTAGLALFAESLTVLDHHVTAEAELAGLDCPGLRIVFDMKKSGARLAWEHFHPEKPVPWMVKVTEDRDLWLWKLPASREINAWIASHQFDFRLWYDWHTHISPAGSEFLAVIKEGGAILRYQTQKVAGQVANASEIEMDGYKVLCVNATHLISEIAGALAVGRPFGVCWFEKADGVRIYSLRSREGGIDVSEVAKRRGGGGHKAAAGFEQRP